MGSFHLSTSGHGREEFFPLISLPLAWPRDIRGLLMLARELHFCKIEEKSRGKLMHLHDEIHHKTKPNYTLQLTISISFDFVHRHSADVIAKYRHLHIFIFFYRFLGDLGLHLCCVHEQFLLLLLVLLETMPPMFHMTPPEHIHELHPWSEESPYQKAHRPFNHCGRI